ncbi:MAG: substrate-binding domain-containing protein [Caldilineaceae bacterium]|nr:substrate-binding domain-containing protein [Caldilineaceae bacterium]
MTFLKSKQILFWLLALTMIVASCATPSAAPGATSGSSDPAAGGSSSAGGEVTTVYVSGAFALFPMMAVWAEEYQKVNPNVRFDIQGGGAGKGMTDVLSNAVDIAMVSRETRPEEEAQGAFPVPVTIDAVVGTFNANNPYRYQLLATGITSEKAAAIWISGEITTWGQLLGTDATEPIHVYTRSDASGAGEMWAKFSGGVAQEDLSGTAVNADPGLAEAVRQDPLGVGYNNIGFTYDLATGAINEGLQVIPIDLNGNGQIDPDEDFYQDRDDLTAAIAAEIYPYPPARPLYLVTKGEPNELIRDFYRWVLTDGQAFVPDAGYINLPEARIQEALELIGQP